MYELIWLIESILNSDLVGVVIGVVVLIALVNAFKKKKKVQKKDGQASNENVPPRPVTVAQPEKPAQTAQPVQLRMDIPVLPDRKPPRRTPAPQKAQQRPAAGSLAYASTEGVEMHAPGFHGSQAPRLEKVDLGALRAQENAHTAGNADWSLPNESRPVIETVQPQAHPRYTAAQLRDAMIMKEILDAPLSRRQGVRRSYGRSISARTHL